MDAACQLVTVHKLTEITVIDSVKYYALNLDIASAITTTADSLVSSMPCFAGETDKVIGRYDGSFLSNTDGNHTFRIHGVEYMWGQYVVICDTVLDKHGSGWDVYVAQKGVAHVKDAHTNYTKEGAIPYNNGGDIYGGDYGFSSRAYFIKALGSSSSNGTGDIIYEGGTGIADGTLREFLTLGYLWNGSTAGLGIVSCRSALGDRNWTLGSRD